MVARHVCGELGADGRGSTGRGTVHMRDKANGLESRRTERAACARRVVRTLGRCDGAGCACGVEKYQRTGAARVYARHFRRRGASTVEIGLAN